MGLVTTTYLAGEGAARGLVRVLPAWSFEPLTLYAVCPRASRRSRAVEAMTALIQGGFEAWWSDPTPV